VTSVNARIVVTRAEARRSPAARSPLTVAALTRASAAAAVSDPESARVQAATARKTGSGVI
jgi:hypothetical protein